MDTKTIVTGLITAVIGIAAGYFAGTSQAPAQTHGTMESAMHSMTSGLAGKTGDAFDKAFLEEMIVHHEGAVQMARDLLKNTTRPELKKLGEDIISAQTKEINMMHDWQHNWFGKTD